MPPPCQSANTPGACGAAAINDSVNGTLPLVMDMLSSGTRGNSTLCTPVVAGRSAYLSHRFDSKKTENVFSRLPRCCGDWHGGCRSMVINKPEEGETTMPLKPNGALCRVREQIIED